MDQPATKNATEDEPPRPYWIPHGVEFDSLPDEMKTAIVDVIYPAYRELVLKASEGLEQSTGITIVHLLWQEVLDQIQMGQEFARGIDQESWEQREKMVSQYLRLVGAKNKSSNFLLRLNEFRQKWGVLPGYADPLYRERPLG